MSFRREGRRSMSDLRPKKRRYLAWKPKGQELKYNELPYFGAQDGDRFFHGGGLSRMPMPSEDEMDLLYDFGIIDEAKVDSDELYLQFFDHFPPKKGTLDELFEIECGWMTPSGGFYVCQYTGHDTLSERLCHLYKVVPHDAKGGGFAWCRHRDCLLEAKWILLSPHFVHSKNPERVTKKQRAVIVKIATHQLKGRASSSLKDAANRFLRDWEV